MCIGAACACVLLVHDARWWCLLKDGADHAWCMCVGGTCARMVRLHVCCSPQPLHRPAQCSIHVQAPALCMQLHAEAQPMPMHKPCSMHHLGTDASHAHVHQCSFTGHTRERHMRLHPRPCACRECAPYADVRCLSSCTKHAHALYVCTTHAQAPPMHRHHSCTGTACAHAHSSEYVWLF